MSSLSIRSVVEILMQFYLIRILRCWCDVFSLGSKMSVVKFHVAYVCVFSEVVGWLSVVFYGI